MNIRRIQQVNLAVGSIRTGLTKLEHALSEEMDYNENLPKTRQESDKAEKSAAGISVLEEVIDTIADQLLSIEGEWK